MKIKQLLALWASEEVGPVTDTTFNVHLPLEAAAKVMAIAEIFRGRNHEQVITELLTAALDEIEEDFPYVQGSNIQQMDEFNDPVYEDVGLTPLFSALTEKYLKQRHKEHQVKAKNRH